MVKYVFTSLTAITVKFISGNYIATEYEGTCITEEEGGGYTKHVKEAADEFQTEVYEVESKLLRGGNATIFTFA